jgi:hypothetical protein
MRGKFLSYTTRLVALLLLCGILSGASKIQSATLIPIALSAEPALMIDNHIPLSARLLPQQVATSGTADVRVAAGNDDAEQEGADGSGRERTGADGSGRERTGADGSGRERTGADGSGREQSWRYVPHQQ